MNSEDPSRRTVVILGGGPASSTLATMLAREGVSVGVFFESPEASILVGESLVPGVIPILRELGVERDVREFSRLKPGATVRLRDGTELEFVFEDLPGLHPDYSYNVPRDKFNRLLRSRAKECGVKYIRERASVKRSNGCVRLTGESRERFVSTVGDRPDFVIDATGRARFLAEKLNLPSERGSRTDTALFTHFDELPGTEKAHIYTDVLEYGWSWRIPLPNRDSFGIVADTAYLDELGSDPSEKLEACLNANPRLKTISEAAKRIEPVLEFSNYQWFSRRLYGSNWVLLGDAAGFVDPVFSTGLYLALQGARKLARCLIEDGENAIDDYEKYMVSSFEKWTEIVNNFYDGRLLALFKMGKEIGEGSVKEAISPRLRRDIGTIFTGRAGESEDSFNTLRLLLENGLGDKDPEDFRIHGNDNL